MLCILLHIYSRTYHITKSARHWARLTVCAFNIVSAVDYINLQQILIFCGLTEYKLMKWHRFYWCLLGALNWWSRNNNIFEKKRINFSVRIRKFRSNRTLFCFFREHIETITIQELKLQYPVRWTSIYERKRASQRQPKRMIFITYVFIGENFRKYERRSWILYRTVSARIYIFAINEYRTMDFSPNVLHIFFIYLFIYLFLFSCENV